VDFRCCEAEQDRELFAGGLSRRRAEIYDQAMITLAHFKPFAIAEKALIENIDVLERLSDRDPEQIQMHQKLKQGLRELKEGVEATKRMVLERCRVRESASV
jgi:hypothetical protein